MSKTSERRERQREALTDAAEKRVAAGGLSALKARELAADIGIPVGAIYNLVDDLAELGLRVAARTLARLDSTLSEAASRAHEASPAGAADCLVGVALAYRRFAADNLDLWRALFEQRIQPDDAHAGPAIEGLRNLFRLIVKPLELLMPHATDDERFRMAQTLYGAVHGVMSLAFEHRLVAVSIDNLDAQIEGLVRLCCRGLMSAGRAA